MICAVKLHRAIASHALLHSASMHRRGPEKFGLALDLRPEVTLNGHRPPKNRCTIHFAESDAASTVTLKEIAVGTSFPRNSQKID